MTIPLPSACWLGWRRVRRVLPHGAIVIIEFLDKAPRGWGSA